MHKLEIFRYRMEGVVNPPERMYLDQWDVYSCSSLAADLACLKGFLLGFLLTILQTRLTQGRSLSWPLWNLIFLLKLPSSCFLPRTKDKGAQVRVSYFHMPGTGPIFHILRENEKPYGLREHTKETPALLPQ